MPMNPNVQELDPLAETDCYWDLVNDTVASAAWTSTAISPAGTSALTIGTPVNTSTRTRARISGGSLGSIHRLTTVVTGASGQKLVGSRYLKIVRQ